MKVDLELWQKLGIIGEDAVVFILLTVDLLLVLLVYSWYDVEFVLFGEIYLDFSSCKYDEIMGNVI